MESIGLHHQESAPDWSGLDATIRLDEKIRSAPDGSLQPVIVGVGDPPVTSGREVQPNQRADTIASRHPTSRSRRGQAAVSGSSDGAAPRGRCKLGRVRGTTSTRMVKNTLEISGDQSWSVVGVKGASRSS